MMIGKMMRVLGIVLGIAALVGVLALLYLKTRAVDAEKQAETVSYLKQLKQLDAEWNVDVLKTRTEMNKNYDPLTGPLSKFAEAQEKLGQEVKASGQPSMEKAFAELKAAFEEKIDLVDQFKAQNAILKNSLRYVPTAVEDLRGQVREARHTEPNKSEALAFLDLRANQVLNDVLRYNLLPDPGTAQNIETTLTAMETAEGTYPAALTDSVRGLVNHTRTILRQRVVENELLKKIASVPMAQKIDRMNQVFDETFQSDLANSDEYRNYLLIYSVLLLTLLAWFGGRLFMSYKVIARVNADLKTANETLEQRVQARTAELSQALVSLKESEAQLIQSEKMASLGQMVAGVAHEINTPLAYVRSSLETVESQLSGIVSEFADEAMALLEMMRSGDATEEQIAETFVTVSALMDNYNAYGVMDEIKSLLKDGVYGVDQIKEIVVNLKNFSRLDRSRVAKYTLEEGLESTLLLAKNIIKSKKINRYFGSTLPITCSPSQINQVFLNLITNAAQATADDGGIITLVTKMRGPDCVAVEVMDNGRGIPDDILPKIFDPFFTTKEVGAGTGLGLSIAHKIVQQHGGEFKVHSKIGVGAKFSVILPINPPAAIETVNHGTAAEAIALAA